MNGNHLLICLAIMFGVAHAATAQSNLISVTADVDGSDFLVETPAVRLPASALMDDEGHVHSAVFPPLVQFEIPSSGYLYGVAYELVDDAGRAVPRRLLHHFNVIDPDHREMFLPIARRIFAAGQETGDYAMPKTLVGIPFEAGDRWLLTAMLHNPTDTAWEHVTLKVRFRTVRRGLPWPLAQVVPFQMDALFPTGNKSFDLPPGASSKSWEGYPVTEGRIIAIGSHMHEMATEIRLEDATDGKVLWSGTPVYDENGMLERTTRGEFYGSFGIVLEADRRYRVIVEYDNPGSETVPDGGMGVLAGLIIPTDPSFDFSATQSDSLYMADRSHFMREGMDPMPDMDMESTMHAVHSDSTAQDN